MNACRINYPRESTQLYINNGGINTRVLQPDYTFVSVKKYIYWSNSTTFEPVLERICSTLPKSAKVPDSVYVVACVAGVERGRG